MGFQTADVFECHTCKTGNATLDEVLHGGLELGLMYLFYGDRVLNNDLLRMAVHAQLPIEEGGLGSPSIIIDSNNMLKIERMTDYCYEFDLEPETVMDNVFITRAFNSSQTYALIVEQLEEFFERVPAKLLIIAGLADIYVKEGITGEGLQQLAFMSNRLMTFSLRHNIATMVSSMPSERNAKIAGGGRALNTCAQVHIHVEQQKARTIYRLVKHPVHGFTQRAVYDRPQVGYTLPLSYFIDELKDDE